jgi:hypothetical protein
MPKGPCQRACEPVAAAGAGGGARGRGQGGPRAGGHTRALVVLGKAAVALTAVEAINTCTHTGTHIYANGKGCAPLLGDAPAGRAGARALAARPGGAAAGGGARLHFVLRGKGAGIKWLPQGWRGPRRREPSLLGFPGGGRAARRGVHGRTGEAVWPSKAWGGRANGYIRGRRAAVPFV